MPLEEAALIIFKVCISVDALFFSPGWNLKRAKMEHTVLDFSFLHAWKKEQDF